MDIYHYHRYPSFWRKMKYRCLRVINTYYIYIILVNKSTITLFFTTFYVIIIYGKFFSYISWKYLISHPQVFFFLCNIKYSLIIFRDEHISFPSPSCSKRVFHDYLNRYLYRNISNARLNFIHFF